MSHGHHGGQGGQGHPHGGQGKPPGGGGGGGGPIHYGFVKCKVLGSQMKSAFNKKTNETQYHVHAALQFGKSGGSPHWDSAINVGTDTASDLLRFKFTLDFQHPMLDRLSASHYGFTDLSDRSDLPALDFLRSDILNGTEPWQDSDVMDGSPDATPVNKLKPLLDRARSKGLDVYIFGREYDTKDGIHDVHMNQGSTGSFLNRGSGDRGDHNRIWEDGAVLVDLGAGAWAAYFTAFTQQMVPTDRLGNPAGATHGMGDDDDGSLINA